MSLHRNTFSLPIAKIGFRLKKILILERQTRRKTKSICFILNRNDIEITLPKNLFCQK